jgi:hypothetical protein
MSPSPDLLLLFGGLFLRCLFRLLCLFGHVTLSNVKSVQRTCAVENRRARHQDYITIVKLIQCCSSPCRCAMLCPCRAPPHIHAMQRFRSMRDVLSSDRVGGPDSLPRSQQSLGGRIALRKARGVLKETAGRSGRRVVEDDHHVGLTRTPGTYGMAIQSNAGQDEAEGVPSIGSAGCVTSVAA